MPVVPNLLERLLLFRLNRAPAPILDIFGAAGFEAVTLAIDLDLLETLDDAPAELPALAARLSADEDGLRALVGFLEAQGYVTDRDGTYATTEMTSTWLTGSETNIAPWFTFWRDLVFPFWSAHLETAVREGGPPQTLYEWLDGRPDGWEKAQAGFRAVASLTVGEVAEKLSVPDDASRLLDVGGGHGLYAIELCRRHPALSATVFDLPAALDVARDEIEAAGLEDRVWVEGGDYETDDLGEGYEVALLFNVVHSHDAAENVGLFERVRDALAPGGRIVVLDQLEGSARMPVGKAGLGFVGLTYLATLGAEIHPYDEVADWLRSAGFVDVRRTAIRRAGPGNALVVADVGPGA